MKILILSQIEFHLKTADSRCSHLKKHFQVIKTEFVGTGSLASCEDVVGQVELLLLELEDPLLHRPLHHEPEANRIS